LSPTHLAVETHFAAAFSSNFALVRNRDVRDGVEDLSAEAATLAVVDGAEAARDQSPILLGRAGEIAATASAVPRSNSIPASPQNSYSLKRKPETLRGRRRTAPCSESRTDRFGGLEMIGHGRLSRSSYRAPPGAARTSGGEAGPSRGCPSVGVRPAKNATSAPARARDPSTAASAASGGNPGPGTEMEEDVTSGAFSWDLRAGIERRQA